MAFPPALGKLAAVRTASPDTATGALVFDPSPVCQSSAPVEALNAQSVPLNVVVKTTSLATVAAP